MATPPRFFIVRPDTKRTSADGTVHTMPGPIVPLVAIDELPEWLDIVGVPRQLEVEQTIGLCNLGTASKSTVSYDVKITHNATLMAGSQTSVVKSIGTQGQVAAAAPPQIGPRSLAAVTPPSATHTPGPATAAIPPASHPADRMRDHWNEAAQSDARGRGAKEIGSGAANIGVGGADGGGQPAAAAGSAVGACGVGLGHAGDSGGSGDGGGGRGAFDPRDVRAGVMRRMGVLSPHAAAVMAAFPSSGGGGGGRAASSRKVVRALLRELGLGMGNGNANANANVRGRRREANNNPMEKARGVNAEKEGLLRAARAEMASAAAAAAAAAAAPAAGGGGVAAASPSGVGAGDVVGQRQIGTAGAGQEKGAEEGNTGGAPETVGTAQRVTAQPVGKLVDVTQTKTITAVVSAVDTVTVTTSTTATVATTTVLFTESTTTTASTATNTVLQTTTFLTTSTNVVTAPGITTTTTVYGGAVLEGRSVAPDTDVEVVARGNNPWGIPDYAWPACQDWNHYVDACKCFGIHPITVTKKPTTTTVTVTASNAITTTVSTLTTTTTNTVPATATTSATFTAVIEVIASTTITQTVTAASTVVVSTTVTPTVTSTRLCKATESPFRAQFGGVGEDEPGSVAVTTFILDSNGFIERAPEYAPDTVLFAILAGDPPGATQQIFTGDQATVEAQAPVFERVKGCIDPTTNILSLELSGGRNNILSCNMLLYISSGDGSDVEPGCEILSPLTEPPPP
ncbi:hypothetical protein NEMBOFW57_003346 [Staphylotrichum longicolle]|uniref:Uncharacterized protein n=1 Tax=Staphylotrichum longicolle TaxID=669026 RepID=A0AAD4F606_9PEZI|nr:hypothetical protein NEMBOFW57_003346 [Staphylotrichum longicolle]